MEINLHKNSTFLKKYYKLLEPNDIDIEFLYGGRDSGKSRHIAMQLILECMANKHFKCLVIRKVLKDVRDSQYSNIQSIIEEWGEQQRLNGNTDFSQDFEFNSSRLEIIYKPTGAGFFGRGLDDVGRIKSFNNPTTCWIEEGNQIEANDLIVIQTSLRSNNSKVKTWFSFNPECEMNYTDFWLWQEYFSVTPHLNFIYNKKITVDENIFILKVRATHGTYRDNPYCSTQRKALYESYKTSKNNSYWYQTYTLGLWGYRKPGGEFWKCFDEFKHTIDFETIPQLKQKKFTYHVVVDSNVNPYVSVQLWCIDGTSKALLQMDELPCSHPNNTATKAALQVVNYFDRIGYNDTVFIYGDPSANAKNTIDDEGRSFFDKFIGVIKEAGFNFVKRVGKSAPSVSQSGSFINEIFESNYEGWKIFINTKCRVSIEDYNMTIENPEGGILKKRITNKETGLSYEKYGHYSDCMRYFITTVLAEEYKAYLNRRNAVPKAGGVKLVNRTNRITP
jgi:PBSX family phage terminase large subunit